MLSQPNENVKTPSHPDQLDLHLATGGGYDGQERDYSDHPDNPQNTQPKYPDITVQLSGEDGNSMFIISRVRKALRDGGVCATEIDAFTAECMSGDYDNVLQTCMKWVNTK